MPIPEVSQTIYDNALGIAPEAIDGITAKIGMCSRGTPNTLYSFGDTKLLRDTLGVGPLVEAAAHLLAVAGGPIYCVPATKATPGTTAPVVTHTGSGTPLITVAGEALDDFAASIEIVGGGALGVGTFRYTLDGGDTFSSTIMIPSSGTYVIPDSGLTVTFPAGTYVAGDAYTFSCIAPMYDSSSLTAALNALMADPREWRFVHVVGQATTVSGSAGLAATIDTALQAAATNFRYARAIMECPDDTDANLIAGFSSFASANGRVTVVAGFAELTSQLTGRTVRRHGAWPATARAAKIPVHEDWGRFASGPLPGVVSIYRDERATPGLDSQRFVTLRTFTGQPGFYITTGRTAAGFTSDYQLFQNGCIIDKACRTIRTTLLKWLNESLRVDAKTGRIFEADALKIERSAESALADALVSSGNASSVSVKVIRTDNLLSTQTLRTTHRVTPKGYARFITADVGLYNPALTPV